MPAVQRKQFTRAEVDLMTEAGIFAGQRLELLNGELIDKMGQKPPHSIALARLIRWAKKLIEGELLVQQPIEVSGKDQDLNLPEPDVSLVGSVLYEIEKRHPRGDELLLAVEVADTSVRIDLQFKAGLYARAGVPEYWVLDLNRRVLVVHRGPEAGRFREIIRLGEEETVAFRGCSIGVAELLP